MNTYDKYLKSVGIEDEYLSKAKSVLKFYIDVLRIDIKDIFISEYMDSENRRNYESMFLFSKNQFYEAKQFLTVAKYDGSVYKQLIHYWEVTNKNYEFEKITPDSRMTCTFASVYRVECHLKASGKNCKQLMKIFKTYVLPNIIKSA